MKLPRENEHLSARRDTTILLDSDEVRIPRDIVDLDGFRAWAGSDAFPEHGRIDWIGGDLEVDMAAEDLNTHGTVKSAVARVLGALVEDAGRGVVLIDRSRVSARDADLSAEPDVVVVLFASIDAGRVRLVPKAGADEGRYVEIEGPADLIVECVSDSSVGKDTRRLPAAYARAGVPEFWLVDARRDPASFAVQRLVGEGYEAAAPDADGFQPSPLLDGAVRLVRLPPRSGVVLWRLEHRERP